MGCLWRPGLPAGVAAPAWRCCRWLRLFKAVIFFHGLVVQILAVYHEQNLINIGKIGRQLRRFEGGQRFAAACCVPDVPACRQCSRLLVVGRNLNAGQNTLGGRNLVRTHHQQQVFGRKDAILRQDVQQRMAGKNVRVKSTKSGMTRFFPSAQKDVNSKLLLVFCRSFGSFRRSL